MMDHTIQAHFDGRVIVPDQPVDLPVDQPLEIQVKLDSANGSASDLVQREALDRLIQRALHGLHLPLESLRRESLCSSEVVNECL